MRARQNKPGRTDRLTMVFAALAHPARRAMLDRLSTGSHSVSELARPFRMAQPTISKHLQVLERAGLVSRGRDAQWRPRALDAARLREANAYLEKFRKHWENRLDRMEAYLKTLPDE
ncbi:MAG: metalloregulator ArsR/SmtB family transcription factor [Gemmatimonadota bacterium]